MGGSGCFPRGAWSSVVWRVTKMYALPFTIAITASASWAGCRLAA